MGETKIDRRKFLKIAGLGGIAAAGAAIFGKSVPGPVPEITSTPTKSGEQFGPTPAPIAETVMPTPEAISIATPMPKGEQFGPTPAPIGEIVGPTPEGMVLPTPTAYPESQKIIVIPHIPNNLMLFSTSSIFLSAILIAAIFKTKFDSL